jgi:DNA-binding Xre family transcriptional regulator
MDLMEILKALFGDEALTFEQFAEKVNNAADVRINLEHLDRICEVLNCNISEQFEYQPIRSKSRQKNNV